MQEVYKNGTLGMINDFDVEKLRASLLNPTVDHVRVFDREKGGQIQIEISDLKTMIIDAVEMALKKQDILNQYEKIKKGQV